MTNRHMRMADVLPGFDTEPRGFYRRIIKQFLDSGHEQQEMLDMDDPSIAYNSLRRAVSSMGALGQVYVEKKNDRVRLLRRG